MRKEITEAIQQLNTLCHHILPLTITENLNPSSCTNVCCIKDETSMNFYGRTESEVCKSVQQCQSSMKSERLASARVFVNDSGSPLNEHGISEPTAVSKANCNSLRQFSWFTHTRLCETFSTRENIILKVYCADILNVPVDGIVNYVNDNLEHGVGLAKAKNKVTGKDLAADGDAYLKKHGKRDGVEEKSGQTKPGNVPYTHMLYAIRPCWSSYKPYQKTDVTRYKHDIFTTILESLKHADKKGIKTIAIPINSGVHECPLELCSIQYAKAILEYSSTSGAQLEEIHFVSQNKETVLEVQGVFHKIITPSVKKAPHKMADCSHMGQQDPKMKPGKGTKTAQCYSGTHSDVDRKTTKYAGSSENRDTNRAIVEYPSKCHRKPPHRAKEEVTWCLGPSQNLFIYTADLLSLTDIDMAVCAEARNGKGTGFLTKGLAGIGDPSFCREKERAFVNAKKGDVILVKNHFKKFPFVAHAILFLKTDCHSDEERKEKVEIIFSTIWKLMEKNRCGSVALPLIGTGKGKADLWYYGQRLINTLTKFVQQNTSYKFNVHLVHNDQEKTNDAIKAMEKFFDNCQKQNALGPLSSVHCTQSEKKENSFENQGLAEGSVIGQNRMDANPDNRWCAGYESGNDGETNAVTDDDEDKDCHVAAKKVSKLAVAEPKTTEIENCVICMDDIKHVKVLKCGHKFCSSCIEEQFKHKQACPSCGHVCGIITGDQPEGEMSIHFNNSASCAGYEKYGRIEIKYTFPNGVQKASHPSPGTHYKGITRTGFLPNNQQGMVVLEMLKLAFARKLIFTIGRSRTTGHEGVITWNDIHHKTESRPNLKFGYPDPTYLDRVTDELAAKGVTPADIPSISR